MRERTYLCVLHPFSFRFLLLTSPFRFPDLRPLQTVLDLVHDILVSLHLFAQFISNIVLLWIQDVSILTRQVSKIAEQAVLRTSEVEKAIEREKFGNS